MKPAIFAWAALLAALPLSVAAQERIDTPGTYVHDAARTAFPERVGDFQRTHIYRYDPEGANVSASYSLTSGDGRLHLTVYVYPSPRVPGLAPAEACSREFEESRAIIARQNEDAERIEDGAAPAADGTSGRRSVFRFTTLFDGEQQPVRSEIDLYCHVGGEWQVKYRATSPVALDPAAAIEAFIRTGPWPGRAPGPDKIVAVGAADDLAGEGAP